MGKLSVLLVGAALLLGPAKASADFVTSAETILRRYTSTVRFSGVVLVVRDGEVLFRRGYGEADAAAHLPMTATARFAIGSLTKQFTAVAVLRLIEQGKVALTTPIESYYPGYAGSGITVHHLLTHTTGIPDYFELDDIEAIFQRPNALAELVAALVPRGVHFAPGKRYEYSNSNYALAGGIVEKVSGESYETFLQRLFEKAWMAETGIFRPDAPPSAMASGHRRGAGKMVTLPASALEDLSRIPGDGALYSTVDDLALWIRALAAGQLLGAEAMRTRVTPMKSDYACGVVVGKKAGRPAVYHNGSVRGYRSFLAHLPDDDVILVVLSNLDPVNEEGIADELLRALFSAR